MIPNTVLVDVLMDLFFSREFLGDLESFPDGAGIGTATADVINFPDAGSFNELLNKAGDVVGVDVVADLFALVAENLVFAAFQVAFDQIGKEAVELDAAVVGPGETAAAQTAGGQSEIAAVFLDHDIGCYLGRAKERVLGLVDGEVLGDAVCVVGIGVVPAGFEFGQSNGVRPVAIDLVGGHVDEGRFRAGLAGGFQQIKGTNSVGVEVIERDRGGAVVRRLGGGVDDRVGPHLAQEGEDALAVADVEFVMNESVAEGFGEATLVPASVALRAEEHGALVVVHAMDFPTQLREVDADFGANEAGGSGDEEFHEVKERLRG